MLIRTTVVVGLIAALAASVNRVDPGGNQDDVNVTSGTPAGDAQVTAGVAAQPQGAASPAAAGSKPAAGTGQAGDTTDGTADGNATAACLVSYAVAPDAANRYAMTMVITNSTTARVNGWTLRWDFPREEKIIYGWNAMVANGPTGAIATGIGPDQAIAPGAKVTIGFAGQKGKWVPTPTGFTLNGQPCDSAPSANTGTNPTPAAP